MAKATQQRDPRALAAMAAEAVEALATAPEAVLVEGEPVVGEAVTGEAATAAETETKTQKRRRLGKERREAARHAPYILRTDYPHVIMYRADDNAEWSVVRMYREKGLADAYIGELKGSFGDGMQLELRSDV